MKTMTIKTGSAIVLTALTVLFSGTVFPSVPSAKEYPNVDWQRAELNYIAALTSDNLGVRRSAVNFLGEYRLTNAIEPLITVLKHDKVENVRMAAALALILIGVPAGRAAVEEASLYDGSDKVAKFCQSLLTADNSSISATE